ncbi:hypothetical protein ACTFIV_004454 [Dictyostelium citrinum]
MTTNINQISSVEQMIKNEEIKLLKNKVNNGDFLFFKETSIKKKLQMVQYEFSIFNQRDEFDYEFYKKLFKNYPNYFLLSKSSTAENKILPYDNVIALKVLINEFNYQPTPSYLICSIRNSKFQISNYLNENHKSITTDLVKFFNDDGKAIKIISTDLNAISIVPILINYRNLFTISLSKLFTTCFKIIEFSNQLDGFINFMNDLSNGTTNINNATTTTKEQELSFDVVSLLKYFKYLTSSEKPFKLLSKDDINEMKFTDHELKQLVGSFSVNDERVENLIRMILPFSGQYGYSENFTSYQYKYSKISLKPEHINLEINPLEFGVLDFDFYKNRNLLKENQHIFKFIKSDKDKQILFINALIEIFNNNNNNYNKPINSNNQPIEELTKKTNEIKYRKRLSPETFFNLIVGYDNLDYLKMVHQGLFLNGRNQIPFDFIDYVKSNEIFEYILQFININYLKETTPLHNIIKRLIKTGRIELLENLKSNHRELYDECFKHLTFKTKEDETYSGEFLDNQFGFIENINSKNYYHHSTTLNGFKYLYSNYSEFQSCFFNDYKQWEISNLYGINDLKYLINETPLVNLDFQFWYLVNGIDESTLSEFVMNHNSMVDKSNDPQLKKFILTESQIKRFSILNKSIQEVLPSGSPIESIPISFLFDKVSNDLNQLEYLMSNYFKDNDQNVQKQYYLSYLFTNAIFFGRLHIFKYLKLNYPWVFNIIETESNDSQSKNEPSLFSSNLLLSQMYRDIINTGNIDMLLFFTQELMFPFKKILILKGILIIFPY